MHLEQHSKHNPLVIAGPCAAESLSQLLYMAEAMKVLGVPVMRGSLFKPRTEAGEFEGIGYKKGGDWFAEVARQHQVALATEIIDGKNISDLVRKLGAVRGERQLIVWLGSRNQLQTIQRDVGKALKDAPEDTILLIKNQPWGNQRHWEGIVNHVASGAQFSQEHIRKRVALVHRGFEPYMAPNLERWRNMPDFEMAMRVKERTGLKMILDPSHIGGTQDNVFKIMRQALQNPDTHFDGFMIEVHNKPESAMTDAKQQLSIPQFISLMEEIDHART